MRTYRGLLFLGLENNGENNSPQSAFYTIVSTGKPANIKFENNGAVVYVGSSLTVHNPLLFVHKL